MMKRLFLILTTMTVDERLLLVMILLITTCMKGKERKNNQLYDILNIVFLPHHARFIIDK